MRFYILAATAILLMGCDTTTSGPAYEQDLQHFQDKKIRSLFPAEPEMLEIEDVFFGDGTAKKRTYLVQNPDSVTYMVCNLTSDDYMYNNMDLLIEEFKETNLITDMEEISPEEAYEPCYKATSGISDKYFYVKFGDGASSYDMFYAFTTSQGAFPDSALSMYFLENTSYPDAF